MLDLLFLAGPVGVILLGIVVLIYPPHRTPHVPNAGNWVGEALWGGEVVRFASFAILDSRPKWALGFLYLTNLRLVWVPSGLFGNPVPALDPVSIRLTHIEEVFQKRSRLHVLAYGVDFEFLFAHYFMPIVTTGDPQGHKKWLARIQEALEVSLPHRGAET